MGGCCGKRSRTTKGVENLVQFNSNHSLGISVTSTIREQRKERIRQKNMSQIVHGVIDKDDFALQMKEAGSKLVVVDFFANWCGPCKMISPKIEEMAGQLTDVIFLQVDVDDCDEVAAEFGISCMPTFILFKKGAKIEEFSGANAEKLKELILKHNKN